MEELPQIQMKQAREILKKLKPDAERNLQLASPLSEYTLLQRSWKPDEKRWSIHQCLEHIHISNSSWIRNIEAVLPNGIKSDQTGAFDHGLLGGFMIRSLDPSKKSKFSTTKRFNPPADLDGEKVWKDFLESQVHWIQLMERVQVFDLKKNKVQSPFARIIRYRLGDALVLNNLHTTRHLHQAFRVTAAPGFPEKE